MEVGFDVAIEYRIVDVDAAVALGVVVAVGFVVDVVAKERVRRRLQ